MRVFEHVGLIPKNGDKDLAGERGELTRGFFVLPLTHLFHPGTEVVQGIWIDVSIGDELGQIKVLRMSSSKSIMI